MIKVKPNIRSTGDGPSVVLLHSSGSSGRQWDSLVAQLQYRFRLHAVDLHGHGATPAWSGATLRLEDDAALLEPLLHQPGGAHLVGHSYGGAVALKLASMYPEQVRSVSVYEPVLFRLLFDYRRRDRATTEILRIATSIRNWLELGQAERAAQRFIDYWSGDGSWDALPEAHRETIASRMPSVIAHFAALFRDTMTRQSMSALGMPVLVMTGGSTRAATRRLGELLSAAMPQAAHELFTGLGHMGPVTHPGVIVARIGRFLSDQPIPSAETLRQAA